MKRYVIALVLALCLVTAGTGAVSAADAGADRCIPYPPYELSGESAVGAEGCTGPPCSTFCGNGAVEP